MPVTGGYALCLPQVPPVYNRAAGGGRSDGIHTIAVIFEHSLLATYKCIPQITGYIILPSTFGFFSCVIQLSNETIIEDEKKVGSNHGTCRKSRMLMIRAHLLVELRSRHRESGCDPRHQIEFPFRQAEAKCPYRGIALLSMNLRIFHHPPRHTCPSHCAPCF